MAYFAVAALPAPVEIQFIVTSNPFLHFFVMSGHFLTGRLNVYSTRPIALACFFSGNALFA
jgi:hypothetical protein